MLNKPSRLGVLFSGKCNFMHMYTDLMKQIYTMKVPLPLVAQIKRYSGNNKPLKLAQFLHIFHAKYMQCYHVSYIRKDSRTNHATKLDQNTLKVTNLRLVCCIPTF